MEYESCEPDSSERRVVDLLTEAVKLLRPTSNSQLRIWASAASALLTQLSCASLPAIAVLCDFDAAQRCAPAFACLLGLNIWVLYARPGNGTRRALYKDHFFWNSSMSPPEAKPYGQMSSASLECLQEAVTK
eukprot:1159128-Pelagomonas_calceolata.AAC.5